MNEYSVISSDKCYGGKLNSIRREAGGSHFSGEETLSVIWRGSSILPGKEQRREFCGTRDRIHQALWWTQPGPWAPLLHIPSAAGDWVLLNPFPPHFSASLLFRNHFYPTATASWLLSVCPHQRVLLEGHGAAIIIIWMHIWLDISPAENFTVESSCFQINSQIFAMVLWASEISVCAVSFLSSDNSSPHSLPLPLKNTSTLNTSGGYVGSIKIQDLALQATGVSIWLRSDQSLYPISLVTVTHLKQWFSKWSVHQNYLEGL